MNEQKIDAESQLEAFSQWAESLDMDLTQIGNTKTGDINFSDCNTDYAWEAWQSARAPLLSRIAELEKQLQGERQLRQESEGMGLCMSMVHDDLVQAGVIPAGTAPMFITEAVLSRIDALSKDAERLDYLDTTNKRFSMGWKVGKAPAGNISINSIIYLGDRPITIREAIDAAISAREGE